MPETTVTVSRTEAPPVPKSNDQRPLTRIVATVGPASDSAEKIERLIETGVSVFRFNFSHGAMEDHARRLATIRSVAARLGTSTAILGDLQGPKIRVGKVAGDGIEVATGSIVTFTRGTFTVEAVADGETQRISSTYDRLVDDVEPGHRLLVNDGAIRMLIVSRDDDSVTCTVTHGGRITSGKGINLPDTLLSVETITERDWDHVSWSIENGIDILALSFVRGPEEIVALREGIVKRGGDRQMPIVAKIEVPSAVAAIDGIAEVADAIMVARGDLGVELDLAQVPIVQKALIRTAHAWGKPCIVATQMLESMIDAPNPTRAEASDVAAAVIDGADAIMLSGETAVGAYPVIAVDQMRRISNYAEAYVSEQTVDARPPSQLVDSGYRTAALAHGVWTVAEDLNAAGVVVWSEHGGGARYLSQNHFPVPIYAVTSCEQSARRMQLLRGVRPICIATPSSVDAWVSLLEQYLLDAGAVKTGDRLIYVYGKPLGEPRVTDSIRIHLVNACWTR